MKTPLRITATAFLLVLFGLSAKVATAQVSITCPANVTESNDPGLCEAIVDYIPPTGIGLGTNITTTLTDGLPSGSSFPVGTTVVEYTVTNDEGDSDVCSFAVTVNDNEDPVIDCPGDIFIDADDGECSQVVFFDIPTATDNCDDLVVNQIGGLPSGSVFPLGENFVDFQTTDAAGNDGFCRIIIVVNDITDPELECPDDIVVDIFTACDTVINYTPPEGSDICGATSTTLIGGQGPGTVFGLGTFTETYETEDLAGNTATCSFNITINDGAPPSIEDCPADINQVVPMGTCEDVVNFVDPTASDNCPGVSISQTGGPVSGSVFPVGSTEIEYTAVDAAGNETVCTFNVVLTENTLPEIECPEDIEVPNDPGDCGAIVTYTPPVGTDNCPSPSTVLTAGLGSGAFFPIGVTTETYTVTDLSGNAVPCSFTVTVNDVESPTLDCPDDIETSAEAGECEAVVIFDDPDFEDNCPGASLTQTGGSLSGSAFPVGSTTIEYTAEDASGVQTVCSFDIIVTDDEDPEITCPNDISLTILSGACDTVVVYNPPVANDNCPGGAVGLVSGPASGDLLAAGNYTVTFGAQDAAGNTASCSFNIEIIETNDPIIDCPESFEVAALPGDCDAVVNYDDPTATDICGDVAVTLISGLASGQVFPLGITTVVYEAEDPSGNTAVCSFDVTVLDGEGPLLDCSDEIIIDTDPGICGAVYTFDLPEGTDNCPGDVTVVQTSGPASGTELPVGSTIFTFEGTDAAGNTSTCSYEVNVVDSQPPQFADCTDDVLVVLEGNVCDSVIVFESPAATDNCGANVSQTGGPISGETLTVGNYTVQFTATDDSGNSVICEFEIEVQDVTPPEIVCPEPFEICQSEVVLPLPTASDSCGVASFAQIDGPPSGSVFPLGVSTVTFEATDVNGNSTVCSYNVEVLQPADRPILGEDVNICESTSTLLIGNEPNFGVGLWLQTEGGGTIENPDSSTTQVNGLSAGTNTFFWSIDPQNGCDVSSDSITVFVEEGVIVEAGSDQSILSGSTANLSGFTAPPDGAILWTPPETLSCSDCIDPTAFPEETTTYFLTYETPLGCLKTDSVTVKVLFEIPNTITPDDDGVNDVWNIPEIDDFPDNSVQIFNRWGVEVFASTGYNEPWDGTREGDDLPTGSYYYIIDYNAGGKENLNGTVNIIR